MLTPIVTSLDRSYLPGLKALHNSYLQNSWDGFDFWAILDGDKALQLEVERLGIKTVMNPVMHAASYPVSEKWPTEVPAMYWRLLIPEIFRDFPKAIYIDADAIILKNLQPIVDIPLSGKILGATVDKLMSVSTKGLPIEWANTLSFCSSFMVFDNQQWNDSGMLAKCIDLMASTEYHFKCAVQGVAQVAVMRRWLPYPYQYQAHAGHGTLSSESYILHFMATNPWEPLPNTSQRDNHIAARKIWEEYR